ncbi:DUF6531 domain-containing protein [Arachnia propionica]|uniref:Type IV secretion protein Rhs n=1 Tax=Arachnia propionica TaxID=1750 RepID=A0A3P1WU58_9ACTN|nr:DUF6531 domain-containing protein [Arachnia propionica]RRD49721.1 type IV secretion protein Rhs [Arachnia propionica]
MFGAPPTTGYANDPVNTATGNFLEPEVDLGFDGGCAALVWRRMYNSLNPAVGAFGPGWSSWTEAGLEVEESVARWRLCDGREVVFPRLGDGWDRATSEAFWLRSLEDGWEISDNAGGWWRFDAAGRLTGFAAGEGFAVSLHWGGGRLRRMMHERGRWVDVVWDEDAGRVIAVVASDGRRVDYRYVEGRLVEATTTRGMRRYVWQEGFITQVVDADGVVEVTNSYDTHGRVVSQTSQHGRVSRFSYLPGPVTVVADEDGSRSNTWVHDSRGRLVRVVDADGQATSLARDVHGNVVVATERDGGVTASQFDDRSRLVARVTPSGARIENSWDEWDRLTAVRVFADDGEPSTTSYSYDTDSRYPSQIIDGVGGVTRLAWERGQLVRMVDPTGVEFRLGYDQYGDLVEMADGAGHSSRLERDEVGRITASITPSGNITRYEWVGEQLAARVDPDGARWGFEYSAAGRLVATIDPLGARTEIRHDDAGEVSQVTDPLGRVTASFHDDLGLLAATVLPDGRRWEYTHDALSRLVAVTDPEGARWEYTHDVIGRPTRMQDPTGRAWITGHSKDHLETWQYPDIPDAPKSVHVTDRIGRVIASTRGEGGGTHRTRYDQCGRPIEYIDPDGGVTALRRDSAGKVLEIRRPDGSVTRYRYNKLTGRLSEVTDPLGNITTFVTDADNRLVGEIDPEGGETRYTLDACGRIITAEHPVHGRSTWKYDLCGRVVKTWSRFLGTRHFHYDQAGQLIEAVDALGRVTRYSYDTGGRATTITDPLGNVTHREFNHLDLNTSETDPLGRTKHYTYDAAGRLTGHERGTGEQLEWTHDYAGNVHQVIVNGTVVAAHHHDYRAGVLTVDDTTNPDAPVQHRLRWDESGRLVEQARHNAITRYGYDLLGRCTHITTPNGDVTRYGYDPLGRCTRITTPAGPVDQVFDRAGRLVEARTPTSHQTWEYTNGQVKRHHSDTSDGTHDTIITRDDQGRITAITRNGETTSYRHDAAGQLVETRDPHGRVCTWTYDEAGRLVEEHNNDEVIRYIHDAAGQLLQRHTSTGTTHYTYNRAGKRISEAGPEGRIDYAWSALGWLTHITGPTGATSLHVNALGELARVNDADLYWNSIGQPIQINDQAITATWAGTAIGHQWLPTGWRTGRPDTPTGWDTPTATTTIDGIGIAPDGGIHISGLEWLTHRVYQPGTRTFLTPDPLDPITGTAFTGNPYHYANNNPLHAQDPLGLRPVTDEELKNYNDANGSRIFNWKTLTGAGLFVAGLALSAAFPVIGGMVASAGFNLAVQGINDPGKPVDVGSFVVSTVLGGVGGAASAWIMGRYGAQLIGAGASRARDILVHAGVEAGVGAGTGFTSGVIDNINAKRSIWSADFWTNVGASTALGAAQGAVAGAGTRMIKLRGVQEPSTESRVPEISLQDSIPAAASADVLPSSSTPEVPRSVAARRELVEPRRSSGIEGPSTAVPRRAMSETDSEYSALYPPPRRAFQEEIS